MKKKKKFESAYVAAVLIPVALIAFWEIASRTGLLTTALLPSPSKIWQAFINNVQSGALQKNIIVSVGRVLKGYVLGSIAGIILGTAMGLSPWLSKALSVITGVLRPVPVIAWTPILILFLGIGEESKVVVIAIGSFWPVLTSVMYGVRDVDIKYKEVATILKKGRLETICQVIIPAALPSIFSGLRTAVGIAWISVVGAELIASSSGLGYMISYAREMSRADNMFVGVAVIGLIGWLINIGLGKLEKLTVRWSDNVKNS